MTAKKVAVLGLDYVGLPLALLFAKKGFEVVGLDIDLHKIDLLKKGKSYISDVSDEVIQNESKLLPFELYSGASAFKQCDYVVVTVPTPITKEHEPDLQALIHASEFLKSEISKGQTIIYESSTYPGTLEEVILPILEQSGLIAGADFYLGYSPERVDPANDTYSIDKIPKVVSGHTGACLQKINEFYKEVFQEIVPVSSPKVAEMCKLFENIQRLVNISLVNETNSLCEQLNIDFSEALQAAATKPFGFTPYYPGPGIGGHCIPVDPLYFVWKLKQNGLTSELIEAAHQINEQMTKKVVERAKQRLAANEKNILIIGVAYKKDVNDVRESPAIPICETLLDEGYEVNYYDPHVESILLKGRKFESVELTKEKIDVADVVLILTNHRKVDWKLVKEAKKIVDTRGVLNQY
ncbi:nucleotide sugar dehydrogenase [Priestia megaterium]|nr:nucleotide sugar dehydrogenase [Priestia megaterium]